MKNIFSIAVNIHDHNWYNGTIHRQEERYTRKKHNLDPANSHNPALSRQFFKDHFVTNFVKQTPQDLFCFTCSNLGQEFVYDLLQETTGETDFLNFRPNNLWDYYATESYYYIDHHQSHAAYAFLTSGFAESDILAIDGRGWQFNCIFVDKYGKITDLSDYMSIGGLWNRLAQDIGLGYLGAGKVMGLAGYGSYDRSVYKVIQEYLSNPNHKLPQDGKQIIESVPKENVAYTLQYATEELVDRFVLPLKTCDNLCIAGGVAYNGYVNEKFCKHYCQVHVPPAVGDEGQSLGTYMHADYTINGNIHIPSTYAGEAHPVNTKIFENFRYEELQDEVLYRSVAHEIAQGKTVGWYQGCSESGNRALGNRSILADPRDPLIKDKINHLIKKREDFRPFAPAVLEEYYQDYFETSQPSPYMSRIVPVRSGKIPGVTHVDRTARIQTVNTEQNARLYSLIQEFKKLTGIPMLVNTSFNCQEPIVETPLDAVKTFQNTNLDILVVNNYVVRKNID